MKVLEILYQRFEVELDSSISALGTHDFLFSVTCEATPASKGVLFFELMTINSG
jgi:hypothetical protein